MRAVDGASLALHAGEITALVGESGSGKTTIARVLSLVYKPTGGSLLYDGKPVKYGHRAERAYYSNVQLIFQDPFASLNALKKVSYILGRALRIHRIASGPRAVRAKVLELLGLVNLTPGESFVDRYPTDMSGGQRQRIAIARSLAMNPRVLLADEPTSMLDASIRIGVLNLLDRLRREHQLAVLYITHDIASARYLADRVNVMFGGKIVEYGDAEDVIANPKHPYTRQLISAAPDPARYKGSGHEIITDISDASPIDNTVEYMGCRFAARCPVALPKCTTQQPPYFVSGTRATACWRAEDDPSFSETTPQSTATHSGAGDEATPPSQKEHVSHDSTE
ncbi:MAG: ATP-binding cassette domain-containing protein [Microbacteriaceae bacterium]|nr:ATP-binding cassette domain-containing protein [Microbacteriaceae bacterium]